MFWHLSGTVYWAILVTTPFKCNSNQQRSSHVNTAALFFFGSKLTYGWLSEWQPLIGLCPIYVLYIVYRIQSLLWSTWCPRLFFFRMTKYKSRQYKSCSGFINLVQNLVATWTQSDKNACDHLRWWWLVPPGGCLRPCVCSRCARAHDGVLCVLKSDAEKRLPAYMPMWKQSEGGLTHRTHNLFQSGPMLCVHIRIYFAPSGKVQTHYSNLETLLNPSSSTASQAQYTRMSLTSLMYKCCHVPVVVFVFQGLRTDQCETGLCSNTISGLSQSSAKCRYHPTMDPPGRRAQRAAGWMEGGREPTEHAWNKIPGY